MLPSSQRDNFSRMGIIENPWNQPIPRVLSFFGTNHNPGLAGGPVFVFFDYIRVFPILKLCHITLPFLRELHIHIYFISNWYFLQQVNANIKRTLGTVEIPRVFDNPHSG